MTRCPRTAALPHAPTRLACASPASAAGSPGLPRRLRRVHPRAGPRLPSPPRGPADSWQPLLPPTRCRRARRLRRRRGPSRRPVPLSRRQPPGRPSRAGIRSGSPRLHRQPLRPSLIAAGAFECFARALSHASADAPDDPGEAASLGVLSRPTFAACTCVLHSLAQLDPSGASRRLLSISAGGRDGVSLIVGAVQAAAVTADRASAAAEAALASLTDGVAAAAATGFDAAAPAAASYGQCCPRGLQSGRCDQEEPHRRARVRAVAPCTHHQRMQGGCPPAAPRRHHPGRESTQSLGVRCTSHPTAAPRGMAFDGRPTAPLPAPLFPRRTASAPSTPPSAQAPPQPCPPPFPSSAHSASAPTAGAASAAAAPSKSWKSRCSRCTTCAWAALTRAAARRSCAQGRWRRWRPPPTTGPTGRRARRRTAPSARLHGVPRQALSVGSPAANI